MIRAKIHEDTMLHEDTMIHEDTKIHAYVSNGKAERGEDPDTSVLGESFHSTERVSGLESGTQT